MLIKRSHEHPVMKPVAAGGKRMAKGGKRELSTRGWQGDKGRGNHVERTDKAEEYVGSSNHREWKLRRRRRPMGLLSSDVEAFFRSL
jgi:hypothetical protein